VKRVLTLARFYLRVHSFQDQRGGDSGGGYGVEEKWKGDIWRRLMETCCGRSCGDGSGQFDGECVRHFWQHLVGDDALAERLLQV
jgi:hypothetical protein